jgi:SAM-dependent methyltransferase
MRYMRRPNSHESYQGPAPTICKYDILKERTPASYRKNLILKPGSFPNELDFAANSLDAILICRLLHFFNESNIEIAFKKMASWLAPKGRLFALTETPYLKNFQEFIPIYEKRVASGEKFPGYVDNVMKVAPERGKTLPEVIHFLNVDVMSRLANESGLTIKQCHTIARPDFPEDLQLDGRESVGLIAEKP